MCLRRSGTSQAQAKLRIGTGPERFLSQDSHGVHSRRAETAYRDAATNSPSRVAAEAAPRSVFGT
jgi:hypothetical protein